MKTNVTCNTRIKTGAPKQATNLTIEWDGMTEDDIRDLAQQSLVIKLQGGWRKDKAVPDEASIKAVDHKIGTRAPKRPFDLAAALASLSPEDRAAVLAKAGIAG